jgi:hypothetical protein
MKEKRPHTRSFFSSKINYLVALALEATLAGAALTALALDAFFSVLTLVALAVLATGAEAAVVLEAGAAKATEVKPAKTTVINIFFILSPN